MLLRKEWQCKTQAKHLGSKKRGDVNCATDLCNFAHFVYVSLLLFELREGRLDGSDGCVVVGRRARGREPTGVVEPGNVDGRGRWGDYHRSWRRAGGAWRGGGCGQGRGRGWWRCAWLLLWFGLDLQERREIMCGWMDKQLVVIYTDILF